MGAQIGAQDSAPQESISKQLFLTAGSGITPLMSMARELVDRQSPADVVFVHHARTPRDIVFRNELQRMRSLHAGVRVVVVCEADSVGETWHGHRGRIRGDLVPEAVADVAEREVWICGPPVYREIARDLVLVAGADPARVHEESYVFGETSIVDPPATIDDAVDVTTYSVEFRKSQRTVECPADTKLLDAAALAGLNLASSCREGLCGTCKSSMSSGTVDMKHGGGIRPREIDQGKILLCCSTPTSDVVIDA